MINIFYNNLTSKSNYKLSKERISKDLKSSFIGKNIYIFDSINSTNSKAIIEANNNAKDGSVFIAEYQSAGNGRIGRSWFSEKGKDILMSILLYPNLQNKDISKLTLIAGLSICRVLRNRLSLDCKLKWPNDIIIGKKKLCGILTKSLILDKKPQAVVVGIGLNVNSKNYPLELIYKATSISLESGHLIDRSKLIAQILNQFETYYLSFLSNPIIPYEYNELCISLNREVSFFKDGKKIKGKAISIDNFGNLLIETNDKIFAVGSNEVTVQGIY